MKDKHIIKIEKIQILTADVKSMICKTITVHLEANSINEDEIAHIVRWWFYWMGHIYFSRDILSAKSSYEGAIRLAMNKELEKESIVCTRLHIAETKLIS